ncbi:MAG: DUF3368 domain-containing protein, partial [Candidatus Hydrothermarchaeaceae archaeon]
MILSNSVALIYLAKVREEKILMQLFDGIAVSETVYKEVVERGKEGGYLDAYKIEELEGFIHVEKLNKEHSKLAEKLVGQGIERGEAETIALAKQLNLEVILDEKKARNVADLVGIPYFGTLALILRAVKEKKVTEKDAERIVEKMIRAGLRVSRRSCQSVAARASV